MLLKIQTQDLYGVFECLKCVYTFIKNVHLYFTIPFSASNAAQVKIHTVSIAEFVIVKFWIEIICLWGTG